MISTDCIYHANRAGGYCERLQCQGIKGDCGACGWARKKEEEE